MSNPMKKNPFSLYDFLGYVFPGAMAIFFIILFWWMATYYNDSGLSVEKFKLFFKHIQTTKLLDAIEGTIALTIASYMMGHFVAYFSSMTVEKFSIWVYGYPSRFLIENVPWYNFWIISDGSGVIKSLEIWLIRILIAILLLPITIMTLIFSGFLRLGNFFTKKLDDMLIGAITQSRNFLMKYLHIKDINDEESQNEWSKSDYHRIIYHYEYEHMNAHAAKMDNYVALYGFLRSVTFIFNCILLWILIYYVFGSFKLGGEVDAPLVWFIIALGLVTYVFFMSFMKFYRRFTLESFMCLIIDTRYMTTQAVDLSNLQYVIPNNVVHASNTAEIDRSNYTSGTT